MDIMPIGTIQVFDARSNSTSIRWEINTSQSFSIKRILSPSFVCSGFKWQLSLNALEGSPDIAEGAFYVVALEKESKEISISYKISFGHSTKKVKPSKMKKNNSSFSPYLKLPLIISREDVVDTQDPLSIWLELEIPDHSLQYENLALIPDSYPKKPGSLISDISALFTEQKNCDAFLKVGSQVFPVHKLLLRARSSVFAALFEDGDPSGVIEITNLSNTAMANMLQYLYTDQVKCAKTEELCDLYLAAEKYALAELKSWISALLVMKLNIANAIDFCHFGYTHNDSHIVYAVKDFVVHNFELLDTVEWKELTANYPHIASDIILSTSSELARRAGITPNQEQPPNLGNKVVEVE